MNLHILLPFQVLVDKQDVKRLVVETSQGCWGVLPHRLDCVAALVPGVLTYETATDGVVYVAVDRGVMIKTGTDVHVSVRRAVAGSDLARLRESVEHEYKAVSQMEHELSRVSDRLETRFLQKMVLLHHD